MRAGNFLIPLLLLQALPAAALERTEHLNFRVHHQLFGDIGTISETIVTDGSSTRVTADLDIAVTVFSVRIHSVHGRWNEVWQNGYLQQYAATTFTDDATEVTAGQRVGEAFVISAAGKQTLAPVDVQPVNPWSVRFVRASILMSPETGRVFSAVVSDLGVNKLRLGDAVVAAHHYVVTGERLNHLYFDENGQLVQCQYGDITGTVTLTRVGAPRTILANAL